MENICYSHRHVRGKNTQGRQKEGEGKKGLKIQISKESSSAAMENMHTYVQGAGGGGGGSATNFGACQPHEDVRLYSTGLRNDSYSD